MTEKKKTSETIKEKIKKKKVLIIGAFLLLLALIFVFRNGEETVNFVEAEKGDLLQEIFETGSTEKGENVNLSFKEGGRIEKVFVKEGESVERGEIIASLEKTDLFLSLKEAEAALSSAQAGLEKLFVGATSEDIEVAEATVDSANTALLNAQRNLEEQERVAEETLKTAYENVPSFLGEIFSTVDEVKRGVVDIADTYFSSLVVEETTSGRKSRTEIRRIVSDIEIYKDLVKEEEVSFKEKEEALKETEQALKKIIKELDNLVSVAESDFYEDRFTETDKDLLRGYRSTVNEILSETTSFIGAVSSANAEVSAMLNTARGAVDSAEKTLNQAEKDLLRVKADPEFTDVRIQEATVDQARARVSLLQKRITDADLKSPFLGTVSSVSAREGEIVGAGAPVAVLLPEDDIQITLEIYEGDIAKVKVGDEVKASFVAFEDEEFSGEVVFINPAGKIIDGVIYYTVKAALYEYPENVLPQMTVDVTIKTAEKKDVIIIPERAIYREKEKSFVNVFQEGETVKREIKTGLRGEGRMVEVISGLKEGEKVVID